MVQLAVRYLTAVCCSAAIITAGGFNRVALTGRFLRDLVIRKAVCQLRDRLCAKNHAAVNTVDLFCSRLHAGCFCRHSRCLIYMLAFLRGDHKRKRCAGCLKILLCLWKNCLNLIASRLRRNAYRLTIHIEETQLNTINRCRRFSQVCDYCKVTQIKWLAIRCNRRGSVCQRNCQLKLLLLLLRWRFRLIRWSFRLIRRSRFLAAGLLRQNKILLYRKVLCNCNRLSIRKISLPYNIGRKRSKGNYTIRIQF